ncbi:MAG: ATP-binding cassette domain-containing protein [Salibacteraceae bacterium]
MIKVDVTYSIGNGNQVLDFVFDCEIPKEKISIIYGKSGVGKTTLLRLLAGLDKPDEGVISESNNVWFHSGTRVNLSPIQRETRLVFQESTLFPNMSVKENLDFAKTTFSSSDYCEEIITGLQLTELLNLYPNQLSGGQAQRVSIGQMLIGKPSNLFMDEPLTSLDHKVRSEIQEFIKTVQNKYQMTMVIVSHDLEETFKLSDYVILLESGSNIKQGCPFEVFKGQIIENNTCIGNVIRINEISEDRIRVYILVGNQIIKQTHPKAIIANYSLGSEVEIKFEK